ncbi:hypothetical protein Q5P01_005254 [Channa striata]|uniref:Calmin n=1 Tax=Channa striata TaxID=64152 RepID=A0AA88ND76_CHASR|nr:hypothetical protein Q5P01_005254 [Channa striata]
MQKAANQDLEKNLAGEISDHVQPEDQRKAVQKRTFTRWMNVFLQRCDPPVEVHDLFTDIQDGRILMALLEELSGCKLLYRFRSSSHRIFRLNNISKALAFLDDRHVKLFGIDASSIADGLPCAVLNLVWNIILYFQVKEVTGGLQRHLSSSLSSLSMNSYPSSSDLLPQPNESGSYTRNTLPSKGRKRARESKYHGKSIKTLLKWVQRCTSKFGVEVHDFGKSWRSGLAFLAMVKSINPELVDLKESLSREPKENIEQAFMIACQYLHIPLLLEPEDVTCSSPDEQSIITYVSMFLKHCSGTTEEHTTDTEILTPNFGSPASVHFGGTIAYDPQAQALLTGLENQNSEHPLRKRWFRNSSGSLCGTSFHSNGAVTAHLSSSSSDVFSPVHHHQEQSKPSVDESPFSLSSEEGIYSLSALDPDEEDAYSYILDLNKEVFLPYNQLKSQVVRVEEEAAEEINEEPIRVDVCEAFRKDQESSFVKNGDFDLESDARAQSVAYREFVVDKKESSFRHMTNNGAGFDTEPDDERGGKEEPKQERAVRRLSDGDYGGEEMTENVGAVTRGSDETETLEDEAEKTLIFKMANWQKEAEEGSMRGPFGLQVKEMVVGGDKERRSLTFDERKERKLDEEKENDAKEEGGANNQRDVGFKSCWVAVNETTDEYEIRGNRTTGINTEEEIDRKDSGFNMEGLTKNSKDENKEEHNGEVKKPVEFKAVEEKENELKTRTRTRTDKKATTVNHPVETTMTNGADRSALIHDCDKGCSPACSGSSPSLCEGGLILQSLAASCDISPIELEMLLVFWILLYCCLILPQMDL